MQRTFCGAVGRDRFSLVRTASCFVLAGAIWSVLGAGLTNPTVVKAAQPNLCGVHERLVNAPVLSNRNDKREGQEQGQDAKPAERSGGQEFSISGTVVDSATAKPIAHALVVLEMGDRPPRRVMTGEDGTFEIGGIRGPGQGSIEAWKPGYSSPRRVRTDRYRRMARMQAITVGPGTNVTIRLMPEATIAGQVVDENGEPIEGLPVELVFEAAEEGKWLPREQDRATTNEEGRFRFANLSSGRYFVLAGPSEEVSSRDSEKKHTALGYPATFYGGGGDYSTASPIDLMAGRHVDLDIRLALEPFFHVTGTITGSPLPGHPDLRILNAARQRVGQTYLQDANREFQIALLPSGAYTIRSAIFSFEKKQCAVAVKRLELTRDILGLRLAMAPCATIPVNLHVEHTTEGAKKNGEDDAARAYLIAHGVAISNVSSAARVNLYLKDDPTPFSRFRAQAEGEDLSTQWIRNVEPGAYRVEVQPLGGLYVESAQSGLTDLKREDLVVAEGTAVAPIEVRLRDDGAELTGSITGGESDVVAVAIAIPERNGREAKVAISHDGKYRFQNLAPGTYRIVAVDRVDDFAYAERDVMAKYLTQSKEVNLGPNEKATADVEFVRVGRGEQQ